MMIWIHVLWPLALALFSGASGLTCAYQAAEWPRWRWVWLAFATVLMLCAIARAAAWGSEIEIKAVRYNAHHLAGERI